jgi:putative spermidine/putrescine transport system substrate-binding protein
VVEPEDSVKRRITPLTRIAVAALALSVAACAAPKSSNNSAGAKNTGAKAGQSQQAYMTKLVADAKKEGTLNTIALPPDWANYGNIIKAFEKKYGIKVNSELPSTDSQTEIDTAKKTAGQSRAPDVFDVGQSVALANTDMFAPYKVQTWNDIPSQYKDPAGKWVNDYGGYMSIGYDSSKVPAVKGLNDLLGSGFKGAVALNGNPTQAGAAFSGVMMASIASGGSADDIAPGVDFFKKLKSAGNFLPIDPDPTTIESGQSPVVIDWDYLNAAETKALPSWKVVVPSNAVVAGYYFQAINKDAPHPNAARLWEEFLYSDQGQNLWLQGGARPVRAEAMVKAKTIDQKAYKALPPVKGKPVIITDAQTTKGAAYLSKHWAEVLG